MKKQISLVTSNPIGSVAGAIGGWMISTKVFKFENMLMKVAVTVAGAYVGATIQSNMKAKASQPTPAVIKK
jgi:outer membrane lipoprotein SlyB